MERAEQLKKVQRRATILVVSLLLLAVPSMCMAQGELLNVEVRAAKLRAAPRAWAAIVGDLTYGDEVQVIKRDGGWVQARRGSIEGFVHETALTTRPVVLVAGVRTYDPTAEGGQVVLAGKGFAEAVEFQTADKDPKLNFASVDQLEKFAVQPEELESFLRAGRLSQQRGEG